MKAKSAHNKGKRYESFLLDYFKKHVDGYARIPKGSGNGLDKGDIQLPQQNIVIEAKNQKTLKIMDWWEQCVSQGYEETPILVFRNPRKAEFKENMVLMSLEDFTALLDGKMSQSEGVETQYSLDYETRTALATLKNAINNVLNKVPHE